jgi:hypothetical protein
MKFSTLLFSWLVSLLALTAVTVCWFVWALARLLFFGLRRFLA